MTKDEAQHSRWTFYEAVNVALTEAVIKSTAKISFCTSVLSSVTPGKTAPFALFIEYEAWIDCNPKIAF